MRKIARTIAAVASLSLIGSAAQAQTLFTGSGCSGNTFEFCLSWTGSYIDATHFNLFVTNNSGAAPASNANSAFTQILIGNVGIADPITMTAVTGWQLDGSPNGFNGFGLLDNNFGSITTNGINNALAAGQSQLFQFTLGGTGMGTFANASGATVMGSAQIGIHDQGTPTGLLCPSSKGVLPGSGAHTNFTTDGTCGSSTVPEPSTYALMATGLIGLVGVARRRRSV